MWDVGIADKAHTVPACGSQANGFKRFARVGPLRYAAAMENTKRVLSFLMVLGLVVAGCPDETGTGTANAYTPKLVEASNVPYVAFREESGMTRVFVKSWQ